ncbi:MAG TPA: hypothetical protein VH107_01525, partial [Lacipirellulaceae bacterium]|nr:hypothetical protein [Lacipirellulaceae bacterium]
MKGETEAIGGDVGTAILSAGMGRGTFHSSLHYTPDSVETDESGEQVLRVSQRVFSRRVGFRYSLQVLLNSLPLLIVDILAITATIGICRLIFYKLGFFSVGMDVSECLLPVATGFVLLNFELDLYPGARLSPVEELRRLIVSITCMFVVWAIGAAVARGSLSIQLWFLIVVYPACVFTLPIARTWTRHLLGKHTNWGLPALVCGDD